MIREFPLRMADGAMARSLVELREHFDEATVVSNYKTGRLERWFRSEGYPQHADQVATLDPGAKDLGGQLRAIVFSPEPEGPELPAPRTRAERRARLRKYTADPEILDSLDDVAFTQEELDSLVEDGADVVYLCGERFITPMEESEVSYVGVNRPLLIFRPDCGYFIFEGLLSFENVDMDFENVLGVVSEVVSGYAHSVEDLVDETDEIAFGYAAFFVQDFSYGLDLARDAAEQGNVDAILLCGDLYRLVLGSVEEAYRLYEKAADAGSAAGLYKVGCCLREGCGVEPDEAEGLELIRKAALAGNEPAQMHMGVEYAVGEAVQRSEKEACRWFGMAAEQGNPLAQYDMGLHCFEGVGMPRDLERCLEWMEKAAKQGYPPAQVQLASMYGAGLGTKQNLEKSAEWFRKAADQGDALAQYDLARYYLGGWGVRPDRKAAVSLLVQSASQGYEDAEVLLCELCGVERDPGESAPQQDLEDILSRTLPSAMHGTAPGLEDLFEDVSAWEMISAMLGLDAGDMYEEELTPAQTDRYLDSVRSWYKERVQEGETRAADLLKVSESMPDLLGMTGVEQRYNLKRFADRSAAGARAAAFSEYAEEASSPRRVLADLRNASKMGEKDADNGKGSAEFLLALLYGGGQGTNQNWQTAAKWLRKAAGLGSGEAAYGLYLLYMAGKGVSASESKARSWLQKARDLGYDPCVTMPEGVEAAGAPKKRARLIQDEVSRDALVSSVVDSLVLLEEDVRYVLETVTSTRSKYKAQEKRMRQACADAVRKWEGNAVPDEKRWSWDLLAELWMIQQEQVALLSADADADTRQQMLEDVLDE